jgi:hypothetical protein
MKTSPRLYRDAVDPLPEFTTQMKTSPRLYRDAVDPLPELNGEDDILRSADITQISECYEDVGEPNHSGYDDDDDLTLREHLINLGYQEPEEIIAEVHRKLLIDNQVEDLPEDYFEGAYPWLFPYGRGGPRPERRFGGTMTDAEWDAHAMAEVSQYCVQNRLFIFDRYLHRIRI